MAELVPGDPQRLGEYILAGRLGEGGQGVVYEGYGLTGQRVAIKVLHPGERADLRRRFAKEAEATQSVAQFCTARILEVELEGARPYIVSEYVGGPNLRAAVEADGPYRHNQLYRLATGIATALTSIHEAGGVIHRDLKPDNVLIGPDGPRVIDFGIARTQEMSLTPTDQIAGTPAFMAPETVTGQRAGAPADVWAWGAVVVYAASGRHPFPGDNMAGLLHAILARDPDVSAIAEPLLRSLVVAAMSKSPHDRPTSMECAAGAGGGRVESARRGQPDGHDPAVVRRARAVAGSAGRTGLRRPRRPGTRPSCRGSCCGSSGPGTPSRPVHDEELRDGAVGAKTVNRVVGDFVRARGCWCGRSGRSPWPIARWSTRGRGSASGRSRRPVGCRCCSRWPRPRGRGTRADDALEISTPAPSSTWRCSGPRPDGIT